MRARSPRDLHGMTMFYFFFFFFLMFYFLNSVVDVVVWICPQNPCIGNLVPIATFLGSAAVWAVCQIMDWWCYKKAWQRLVSPFRSSALCHVKTQFFGGHSFQRLHRGSWGRTLSRQWTCFCPDLGLPSLPICEKLICVLCKWQVSGILL